MNIIGIFFAGPNTAACLLVDGVLVAAAEEERFIRIKSASEFFPSNAIRYCLSFAKLKLSEIEVISVGWKNDLYPDFMNSYMSTLPGRYLDDLADRYETISHNKLALDKTLFEIKINLKKIDQYADPDIQFYSHHESHCASVYYMSNFSDSAVLIMDGSGEYQATTLWAAKGDNLTMLDEYRLPNSLGWYYSAITEWLGFNAYSGEGKVMGLAPYGVPDKDIEKKLHEICSITDSGYSLDPTFIYYGKRSYSKKFTDKLVDVLGKPRLPESKVSNYHMSVAYELQKSLQEIAIRLAKRSLKLSNSRNLCLGGGVAMNCKMNGILSNLPEVDDIFINPASYDAGTAIGSALLAYKKSYASPRKNKMLHAYYGPEYEDSVIKELLSHCNLNYQKVDDIAIECARLLFDNKIVGWFQGRSEIGARALGARSILANPQNKNMKKILNSQVKYRESFRPFAPSMIEEVKEKYMKSPKYSPFMILAYEFYEKYHDLFPSVVHVDGSVRPQTVSKTTNFLYWNMINEFGKLSGHPIVINTSFNVRGEPIVNTPLDAVRCFYSTGMDALAIGSFLLIK